MLPAMATQRAHRTQAERRAETQTALLEATVASLAEVGYARTSTNEVARRAGVSRGAQTHHYPTKSELVVAALEYVFHDRERSFLDAFTALDASDRTLARAVDLLWEVLSGTTFDALLELIVAARSDPELRVVLQAVAARFEATVLDLFAELFPEIATVPEARHIVSFAFAVLEGAAVSRYADLFGPADQIVTLLRRLADLGPEVLLALIQGDSKQ